MTVILSETSNRYTCVCLCVWERGGGGGYLESGAGHKRSGVEAQRAVAGAKHGDLVSLGQPVRQADTLIVHWEHCVLLWLHRNTIL